VFTTAVRGALALSMTPVLTMLTAAIFGIEPLSRRKSLGVMIATGGGCCTSDSGRHRASGGLAWRLANDGGRVVPSALWRLVPSIYRAIRGHPIHVRWNGVWCRHLDDLGRVAWWI